MVMLAAGAAALTTAGVLLYNMYNNPTSAVQVQEGTQAATMQQEEKINFAPALEPVKRELLQQQQAEQTQQVVNNSLPTYTSRAVLRKQAPEFSCKALLSSGEFGTISLKDYKGKNCCSIFNNVGKYVVLFFYPLDFTFVCPTEIVAFSDAAAQFEANNAQIIGCSIDSEFAHLAWVNTPRKQGGLGAMQVPLMADVTQSIARDYGVLIDEEGTTLRGTFIIDQNGIIRHAQLSDHGVGRNTDEILRLVQAFQHAGNYMLKIDTFLQTSMVKCALPTGNKAPKQSNPIPKTHKTTLQVRIKNA